MFEFLAKIFPALQATTKVYSAEAIDTQIQQFRQLINGNDERYKTIRLWVDAGASYGHQSSTVNVMYRLARQADATNLTFGYAGTIELYYSNDEEEAKLRELIPELAGDAPHKVEQATIVLVKQGTQPGTEVAFGMSGGASADLDYTEVLKVGTFLRLQPFNWPGAEQIAFNGRDPIDLLRVAEVGAGGFKRRLYTVDRAAYADMPWDLYLNGTYPDAVKEKLRIVQHLVGDDVALTFALQTVYSIKTASPRFSQDTAFGAAMIVGGALEWQTIRTSQTTVPAKPYKNARPVVIVNFDEFGTPEASAGQDLLDVLSGEFGPNEVGFKYKVERQRDPNAIANFERRKAFFKTLQAEQRLVYLNYPTTLAQVTDALDQIARDPDPKRKVLFIQLGRSFPAAFSNAIYRSALPPIFEGQNTANLCVNIGKAYLQLPGTKDTEEERQRIYPSLTLNEYTSQQAPQALLGISSQVSRSPEIWPNADQLAPPTMIGSFMQQYTSEKSGSDTIHAYFSHLKDFFASATQDKLSLAVAYMNTQLVGGHDLADATADDNPLDALYDKIAAAVEAGGPVDLVPGLLAGGSIPDFIVALLKDFSATLTLTKVTTFKPSEKPGTLTQITLGGPTSAFESIGTPGDVEVVFTAPDGVLAADVRFTVSGGWSMPGAPWMAFSNPFVALSLSDGKKLIAAKMGGTYPALESKQPPIVADLEIAVGGADNRWPASLVFSGGYPVIGSAYQLLTGFNVVKALPAPFNALADLGISEVQVDYDAATRSVDTLLVVAQSNTQNLPLFGQLSLNHSQVTAVVTSPAGARKLAVNVSAEFGVGKTDPAVIAVVVAYPGLFLQGSLAKGVLTLSKIVETFVPGTDLMLPYEPVIDDFSFMYDKPNDDLAVSMNMVMKGWDFTFPLTSEPLFSLDRVGFAISRAKGSNTGNITAHTTLLPKSNAPIGVEIGAFYRADKSWMFQARTTTLVDLDALVQEYLGDGWVPKEISFPKLKDLSLDLVWAKAENGAGAKSFAFKAKTAQPWTPIAVLGDQLSATFDLTLGYGPKEDGDGEAAVAHGKLLSTVTLWNIHLSIEYDFAPGVQKVIVIWTDVGLKAVVETAAKDDKANKVKKGDTVATFSLDGESVGSLVEKFVGWATGTEFGLMAPWHVLNDVKLSALSVIYNFTQKRVSFNIGIGPVELGLFTLKGISLSYNPDGNPEAEGDGNPGNKVAITIEGSFVWQSGDSISWAPDDPQSTPAPPGGGNKYLDLRLLALGQHVTVPGLVTAKSVVEVIDKLRNLDIPTPPDIPLGGPNQPTFAPDSAWFVGMDFGVLKVEKEGSQSLTNALVPGAGRALTVAGEDKEDYFISLSVVFNDPGLYALRIALAGPMAKIFNGLDFQIMYQQVSKNVGRYSASIVLPDIMRKLQVGVATVTLPTFGIDVYTNGDFQVDIGFPWNEDFSLSFSVEFMAGPIPVLGSAGFYFGKLSSATTSKVPATRKGWFNPVLVFGFGVQAGLGKSIEAGILSAGFSLTVFGIIEGVIARWLPYREATPQGQCSELQDGYYFALSGTLGIQGVLYGSVNFAIISADLNVRISIHVKVTFASYEPIPLLVQARVDVSLAIKINLGLFKITIHLGFHMQVSASFVLENPMKGPAPWADTALIADALGVARSGQDALAARGLRKLLSPAEELAVKTVYTPDWGRLQPGSKLQMAGFLVPTLTVVGDTAATPQDQSIAYVLGFFLRDKPPVQSAVGAPVAAATFGAVHVVPPEAVARTAFQRARSLTLDSAPDTFENFAIRVLQWVLAAGMDGNVTPDQVNAAIVTDVQLHAILDYFQDGTQPMPIPPDRISAFLEAQSSFSFTLQQEEDPNGPVPGVFFPAAPELTVHMPSFNGSPTYSYAFGKANACGANYLKALNAYFQELKVQIQAEREGSGGSQALRAEATTFSVAEYVFSDYFTMIARQVVQAMRDGLANFLLPLPDFAGKTANQIVEHIGAFDAYSLAELFAANVKHPLNAAAQPLTIAGMRWQAAGGQSFTDLAALQVFGGELDGRALALANSADPRIIAAGQSVGAYITQTGDSLDRIAAELGFVDSAALLTAVPQILTGKAMLAAQSILAIPTIQHRISAGDTLETVGLRYALDTTALASAANGDILDLFDGTGDHPNLNVPHLAQYNVGALIDGMVRSLALQHVSAMMSRYYLHGLRLPTAFGDASETLTPALGVPFAQGGAYPADLGLFALTGQTLPLPEIGDPAQHKEGEPYFSLTVSAPAGSWIKLGDTDALTYTLDAAYGNSRYLQYSAVKAVACGGYLSMQSSPAEPLQAAETKPARFPLAREIVWQSAVNIELPRQPAAPQTPRPRLWSLPNPLINLPNGGSTRPTMALVISRSDEASGTTVDQPVENYGFGTLVSFKIKRLAQGEGAVGRSYEIAGAPESEVVLLERLLAQLQDAPGGFAQVGLFYRPNASGSSTVGWQSDDPARSLMSIAQTNLSTDSRPPTSSTVSSTADDVGTAPKAFDNLIGSPNDFARLLWEASITRQGGYFLTYTTGLPDKPKGLPDHIFNDRGEAEVAFFALYSLSGPEGLSLTNFMNVAVSNQGFDLSGASLMVEAVAVPVPDGRAFQPGTDTLSSYAADYYMGVAVMVELNREVRLADKVSITVEGGLYQVPAVPPARPDVANPGGDLALIAQHFGTTVEEIRAANIAGASLPATLAPRTVIKLPRSVAVIGTSPAGTSFAALSAYFGAPLAVLAAANAQASPFPAVPLAAVVGPVGLAPQLRQGVAGIRLSRPEPQVPGTIDADWGRAYLRQGFSLLAYRLSANPGNSYFAQSNWGLPAGPLNPDAGSVGSGPRAPAAQSADGLWHFQVALPYTAVLAGGDSGASPYLGVGSLMALELAWLDIFGNRIQSELQDPSPPANAPRNPAPQITGYTDRLMGIGQWPSLASAYRIVGSAGAASLALTLRFDASEYLRAAEAAKSTDPVVVAGGKRVLAQAFNAYLQIVAQLSDPAGVAVTVECTLAPSANWVIASVESGKPAGLRAWAEEILAFLKSLIDTGGGSLAEPVFSRAFALAGETINTAQIFKLTATLALARVPAFVNGELRSLPGMARAATLLAPWTGEMDDAAAQQQRGLADFAKHFADAFASEGGSGSGPAFRIATGSDRNVFTAASDKPLWVVQLGNPSRKEAISYSVIDAGSPKVFAPRPVANVLKSKAQTQLLPYQTGKVIEPDGASEPRSFSSVDLDRWMRTALASIDALLVPKYAVPADILWRNIQKIDAEAPNALQLLLDAKKQLAGALKTLMVPVYKDEGASLEQLADMQEAFEQGMLGTLSQFYTVKAGLQFTAEVNSAIAPEASATQAPRVYGDVLQHEVSPPFDAAESPVGSNLTVSSPKLDLRFRDGANRPAYLSSLVSSTSTDAKRVTLDLAYNGQYIEHEIGALPGIENYQPSSWLSFVDLGDGTGTVPFASALGRFDVPIVLRAFPDMPTLVGQECSSTSASLEPSTADYNPLAAATRWTYRFSYAMQVHAQQDEVHGTVSFNLKDAGSDAFSLDQRRDLFDNLAQFVQVYPNVLADLDTYLVPLDVGTSDTTVLRNAQAALQSASVMVAMLAATAGEVFFSTEAANAAAQANLTGFVDPTRPISFTVSEDSFEAADGPNGEGRVEALQVTITLAAPMPAGAGTPLVQIEGYAFERQPVVDPLAASFLYRNKNGAYLTAALGRTIPGRAVLLPGLGIIERQDAQTTLHLTRNADIVPGKTIEDAFVYRTPEISFQGPLHPTLAVDTEINLATIFSSGPNAPIRRSFAEHLAAFYTALLQDAGTPDVTLQLSLYYGFSINDSISLVRLPVYLMPPSKTPIPDGGRFNVSTAPIPNQASAWDAWFKDNLPSTRKGRLMLDLTVMSNLTAQPMPILKLSNAYLDYADIS